jgi:hypothetical protein
MAAPTARHETLLDMRGMVGKAGNVDARSLAVEDDETMAGGAR